MAPTFDTEDRAIVDARMAAYTSLPGARVGDFVRFADGTERRVSHVWRAYDEETGREGAAESIQTSDGGSFYLGRGGISFSGSLFSGVPAATLTATDETKEGAVWVFHHDRHTAHNGVTASAPFRVFTCSLDAKGN